MRPELANLPDIVNVVKDGGVACLALFGIGVLVLLGWVAYEERVRRAETKAKVSSFRAGRRRRNLKNFLGIHEDPAD